LRGPRLYQSCSAIEEEDEEEEEEEEDEVYTFYLLSYRAPVSFLRPVYSVTKSPPFKQSHIVTTFTKAHSYIIICSQ